VSFTREAVRELSGLHGEPDWLLARRLEAFDAYVVPVPTYPVTVEGDDVYVDV